MISATEALERLRAGNRRFADAAQRQGDVSPRRRRQLVSGQEPFAVILGCADSRVPAEIVFDQGLGDLFVIRVAGNVVAPSLAGSVEYAAQQCGTRLVVVLGHTGCGAVQAVLSELEGPGGIESPNLRSIVDGIRPAVENLLETDLRDDHDALMHQAVYANVRASVDQLRRDSQILEHEIEDNGLRIVGAVYSLATGGVDFFDGPTNTL
jgi:carbonic anhydrase